ncbi:putative Ig domain-containing protein [Breznakiellaceae bacterium SP9]
MKKKQTICLLGILLLALSLSLTVCKNSMLSGLTEEDAAPAPSPPPARPTLTITSADSTMIEAASGGSFQVQVNGPGTKTYSTNSILTGVMITASGALTILPNTLTASPTPYTFTITVANGGISLPASQTFRLFITAGPVAPTITSPGPTSISVNGGTYQVVATGTPTITYSVDSTSTTNGFMFNSTPGLLTIPSGLVVNTTYTVIITATNSAGTNQQTLNLLVTNAPAAPVITSLSPLSDGVVNTLYVASPSLAASGDTPIEWTIDSGTLPNGLTLGTDGIWIGIPTQHGDFNFIVKATNAAGSDRVPFSFTIKEAPAFTSGNVVTHDVLFNSPTSIFPATGSPATGYPLPTYSIIPTTPPPPTGLSFNTTTGVFTIGNTTPVGPHSFQITATNGVGTTDPTQLF